MLNKRDGYLLNLLIASGVKFSINSVIERMRDAPGIDMILHCPKCHTQHIDKPAIMYTDSNSREYGWTNPPHRSHLCHECGNIWRPADVATNGVESIKTKGQNDHA